MGLKGSLKTLPLIDLLQWIGQKAMSGTLQLQRAEIAKDIYFEKGVVISAGSNDPREYLGSFFISFGNLSEDDLVRAFQTQRETQVYLGKILVMIGKASEASGVVLGELRNVVVSLS